MFQVFQRFQPFQPFERFNVSTFQHFNNSTIQQFNFSVYEAQDEDVEEAQEARNLATESYAARGAVPNNLVCCRGIWENGRRTTWRPYY